jgi:hypothetical protein
MEGPPLVKQAIADQMEDLEDLYARCIGRPSSRSPASSGVLPKQRDWDPVNRVVSVI